MSGTADFLLFFAGLVGVFLGAFLVIMAGMAWIAHRVVEDSYPDPTPRDSHPTDDFWSDQT